MDEYGRKPNCENDNHIAIEELRWVLNGTNLTGSWDV